MLSTLHANRSASLYNMNEYHHALNDISTALSLPYPDKLHHKVLERQAKCYLAINELKRAVHSFKQALTSLDKCDLNLPAKQKKESDFSTMIALLSKTLEKQGEQKKKLKAKPKLPAVPEVKSGRNKHFPSASDVVNFCESDVEGRYAVAGENIQAGKLVTIYILISGSLLIFITWKASHLFPLYCLLNFLFLFFFF